MGIKERTVTSVIRRRSNSVIAIISDHEVDEKYVVFVSACQILMSERRGPRIFPTKMVAHERTDPEDIKRSVSYDFLRHVMVRFIAIDLSMHRIPRWTAHERGW